MGEVLVYKYAVGLLEEKLKKVNADLETLARYQEGGDRADLINREEYLSYMIERRMARATKTPNEIRAEIEANLPAGDVPVWRLAMTTSSTYQNLFFKYGGKGTTKGDPDTLHRSILVVKNSVEQELTALKAYTRPY